MPRTIFDRANVEDADIIRQFMLEHGASESLALSIVRAKNYSDYMRERLSDPHHQVWVARQLSRIVGVLEIKLVNDTAFVNHVYVAKTLRGAGIGRSLLRYGCMAGRVLDRTSLTELDVLSTNHVAKEWYARLGFAVRSTTTWSLFHIGSITSKDGTYEVIEWASASSQLARFGFCKFSIRTDRGHYAVGLPNSDNYRVNGDAILGDPVAIGALTKLGLSPNVLVSHNNAPETSSNTKEAIERFSVARLAAPSRLLHARLVGSA